MILIYGDDSADEKRQRVSAVAVVVGTERMWNQIEPKWIARNNEVPFHARDCETDNGDYAAFPHERNKELYKDLTVMLAESGLIGRGEGIDLRAQREIFPDAPDIACYKAFVELLEAVKNVSIHFQLPAKFSSENEYNAGLLYKGIRDNSPEMLEWFDPEISFAAAKSSARLKVADLLAYEAMKGIDHSVGPVFRGRKSWEALAKTRRFEIEGFGREWFEDIKKNMPQLEKQSGFNQNDYTQWLKDRNRKHSISNLIHFTNWLDKKRRDPNSI